VRTRVPLRGVWTRCFPGLPGRVDLIVDPALTSVNASIENLIDVADSWSPPPPDSAADQPTATDRDCDQQAR
jgi:hypothetical protein